MTCGFTLFATSIGRCGIAWSERGLTAVQLPEADDEAGRRRLQHRFPQARESAAPPPRVQAAIDAIVTLLAGEPGDLSGIVLDEEGVPPFERRVYEVARGIPPGALLTYGEIATRLGAPGAARAVGRALARNPWAIVVPCHRVLAAGGRTGGFSAHGGAALKMRLLAIESAHSAPFVLTTEEAS